MAVDGRDNLHSPLNLPLISAMHDINLSKIFLMAFRQVSDTEETKLAEDVVVPFLFGGGVKVGGLAPVAVASFRCKKKFMILERRLCSVF